MRDLSHDSPADAFPANRRRVARSGLVDSGGSLGDRYNGTGNFSDMEYDELLELYGLYMNKIEATKSYIEKLDYDINRSTTNTSGSRGR